MNNNTAKIVLAIILVSLLVYMGLTLINEITCQLDQTCLQLKAAENRVRLEKQEKWNDLSYRFAETLLYGFRLLGLVAIIALFAYGMKRFFLLKP